MLTTMSQTRISSHVQAAGSARRPAALSRRVAGVRRTVIRRAAKDGQGNTPGLPRPNLNEGTEQTNDVAEPKVDQSKVQNIAPGNISNQNAEKRADLGATRPPTLFGKLVYPVLLSAVTYAPYLLKAEDAFACAEAQSFDGPAPETINGRLAMLGITSALAAEFVTGVGLREQWLEAPAPILFSFAVIAIASYIPILKGFTR